MTLTALASSEGVDRTTGEVIPFPAPAPARPAFVTVGEPKSLTTLFAKMAKVLSEVARVEKAGENTQQNYRYATASDLLDTVRPLLAKNGIAFFPTVVGSDQKREGKKVSTRVEIQTAYCCAETGAMLVSSWHGEADDWGDKSYWKAYTGTLKYALFQTFLVSTGDDPEENQASAPSSERAPQQREAPREERPTPAETTSAQKPERTEFHTRVLNTINERRKLLPDGYACTVGKTETGDLKHFVREHWEVISGNLELAKKAAAAIDAALKDLKKQDREARKNETPEQTVDRLRGRFFALLKEKHGDVHEADRHAFQEATTGKKSTADWDVSDFERAIAAVEAGKVAEFVCPL